MSYSRVTAAVLAVLICAGSPGSPAATFEPARLGVELSKLTVALGEAVSLPEAHRQFGEMTLQLYTSERLHEDIVQGRKLLAEWLETAPEDAPWTDQLTGSLNAVFQAEAALELLPAARLSAIPQAELTDLMDALDAVRRGLEKLETVIEDQLLSSEERWEFHIGFLCGSLLGAPSFPPPLPEDEARSLSHEIPAHLSQDTEQAVGKLLSLLPEHRHWEAPEWRSAEQREQGTELAWTILVGLGVKNEVNSAEGEG